MNKENYGNINNNSNSTDVLQDYEIEVVKKIGFWANLFYKITKHKDQKLLSSGNTKPQKTYKSISYLWFLGDIKNSVFNTLDNLKNSISYKNLENNSNFLKPEIIGKNISNENNNIENLENVQLNTNTQDIIIPKPIDKK